MVNCLIGKLKIYTYATDTANNSEGFVSNYVGTRLRGTVINSTS
jgi:hypothetical protein